jgi:hypothetical protein
MKLEASQAKVVFKYKNLKLKVLKCAQNIKFNNECLKNQITPKYIHIKINSKSYAAKKAKTIAETAWLKQEVKQLHRKKSMLNKLLLKTHIDLLNGIHPAQLNNVLSKIEPQITKEIEIKKRTQKKKLNNLLNEKHTYDLEKISHKFYPRTINLTNVIFNEEEMMLLNKGLKYNLINNGTKSLFSEVINAEAAIQTITDKNDQNTARVMINNKVKKLVRNKRKPRHNGNEIKVLRNIKSKIVDNNLYVTKADKGNTLVIMNLTDYNTKVTEFINKNNIQKLTKDPTTAYTKEINKAISNSKHLLSESEIRHLKPINPHAPTLKGLPKLHKEDKPIRPLVNYMPAPAYRLAKKLERIIKTEVRLENNHSLKNSLHLIENIKNINVDQRHTLASLDITNLYTNIPVDETLIILQNNLENHSTMSDHKRNELMALLRIVLKQNYFCFNNDFFIQCKGLAMGSPLSGILAEIFLNHLENKNLWNDENRYKDKIIFFYRYVDDIIILYDGNSRQVNIFNKFMNKIHPNMKFTLELEENNSLNFLDLTLKKSDNRFMFNVFRKPTATDTTIHATSHHPMSHKLAAYHSFVNRLLSVPLSNEDYINEKNIIKHIAVSNGYSPELIDKLILKHKQKKSGNNSPTVHSNDPQVKHDFISTEYGNQFPLTLKNEMKKHGKILAFKTTNKLENKLNTKTVTEDINRKTGVYKLSCNDCDKYYVGQTGRYFEKRFKEHLPKSNSVQSSNFASHLIDSGHSYTNFSSNLSALHICSKGQKMTVLESYEIYKATKFEPHNLLNEKCTLQTNALFETLIKLENNR